MSGVRPARELSPISWLVAKHGPWSGSIHGIIKTEVQWDRSGIQRQFRSSGERHQQCLLPWSLPTEGDKTVSFFVSFHRGATQSGILFLVSIERGTSRRVYHRRPWLSDMSQLGGAPCRFLASLWVAPVGVVGPKRAGYHLVSRTVLQGRAVCQDAAHPFRYSLCGTSSAEGRPAEAGLRWPSPADNQWQMTSLCVADVNRRNQPISLLVRGTSTAPGFLFGPPVDGLGLLSVRYRRDPGGQRDLEPRGQGDELAVVPANEPEELWGRIRPESQPETGVLRGPEEGRQVDLRQPRPARRTDRGPQGLREILEEPDPHPVGEPRLGRREPLAAHDEQGAAVEDRRQRDQPGLAQAPAPGRTRAPGGRRGFGGSRPSTARPRAGCPAAPRSDPGRRTGPAAARPSAVGRPARGSEGCRPRAPRRPGGARASR